MARLYADEDFSYPTVEELRRLGHDVLTAQEAGEGDRGKTDNEVLAFAVNVWEWCQDWNGTSFLVLTLCVGKCAAALRPRYGFGDAERASNAFPRRAWERGEVTCRQTNRTARRTGASTFSRTERAVTGSNRLL